VNIALIMHELLVEGGGERQCVSLARELTRQGHQVVLYTSAYDAPNCFPQVCKDITVVDVGRGRLPWLRKPRVLRGYLDMLRLAAAVNTKHQIWHPHHWPAQWGAVWLKHKLGGAVAWMCNDVPNFHQIAHQPASFGSLLRTPIYWLDYLYDRSQNRKVDLTLFLSQWAESEFRAIYPGTTQVVRSGADPDRFKPGADREKIRSRFGYQPDDFVLLWLGIIMPHRRLQDAIHAVGRLKARGTKVKFLLAGSGRSFPDYFNQLQALVRELGVEEEVTFAGKVADEEMRDFYCACDTFLFPNENQTWGLAVMEAMACGCPVLVSQGAAVHEVLTDNENAMLFPPRAPEALADKIRILIDQPQLRRQIAERGMQLTRAKYNWEQFANQISSIFQHLVEQGKPQRSLPSPADSEPARMPRS